LFLTMNEQPKKKLPERWPSRAVNGCATITREGGSDKEEPVRRKMSVIARNNVVARGRKTGE